MEMRVLQLADKHCRDWIICCGNSAISHVRCMSWLSIQCTNLESNSGALGLKPVHGLGEIPILENSFSPKLIVDGRGIRLA
jgi:hypothetical protein